MDWSQLWEAADRIGVIGLLIAFGIAGAKKWLVFGWTYREAVERADKWEERFWASQEIDGSGVEVAERSVSLLQQRSPLRPRRSRVAYDMQARRMSRPKKKP